MPFRTFQVEMAYPPIIIKDKIGHTVVVQYYYLPNVNYLDVSLRVKISYHYKKYISCVLSAKLVYMCLIFSNGIHILGLKNPINIF